MAVVEDDPYNRSPLDPTFRSLTIGDQGSYGYTGAPEDSGAKAGGLPVVAGVMALVHLLGKLFGHGSGTSAPTGPGIAQPQNPATNYVRRDVARTADQADGSPDPSAAGGASTLATLLPVLLKLGGAGVLAAGAARTSGANQANPAATSLNSMVPNLSANLSALLASDVQRRQQSDPLYQAVLTGAMGNLPVWMRNGGSMGGPVLPPRQAGSGVPVTPGTDLLRGQGGDTGYRFPSGGGSTFPTV